MPNLVLVSLLALLLSLASAATTLERRDLTPETAAANASVGAGAHGYTYAGCYNETTSVGGGYRALANGQMESNATATTSTCLAFCHANGAQYAGLEYGQECWCAPYLSALTTRLDEAVCDLACVGNTSEICGGRLALSLYNLTGSSSSSGARALRVSGDWGELVAGVAALGVVVFGLL